MNQHHASPSKHSGTSFRRVSQGHEIHRFKGLRNVTKLSICPVSYWDKIDGGERRRKIIQRNTMLSTSFREAHLLANYNGPCRGATAHYSGRLVVDHRRGLTRTKLKDKHGAPVLNMYFDACSSAFPDYDNILIYNGNDQGEIIEEESEGDSPRFMRGRDVFGEDEVLQDIVMEGSELRELSEHQLLLIPPRAWAFALKTKQRLLIQADYMTEVAQSIESLENLVLDKVAMQTIRALATRQNSKREVWAADFVDRKGAGQIMLLHGPPGVGKTYTVEAIAEFLHRPLLALTVADIGTQETRVESELFKWFSLAEAWNAVLLVDEADIFLERRHNRDLARNGLVSAFLRRMEYFKGLLFLTTNRVGQIDDAFISRVHAAVGYRSFTPQDRVKVWEGFFHKLDKERAGKIQIARGAKKWVLDKAESGGAQLNGRDIRNALQTAITLAEADYEEDPDFNPEKTTIVVEQSHFERVLEISEKFHSYLKSIKKEDEKKRAASRYDRNDFHGGPIGDSDAYPDD
ncbi:P-loop containing nucleoside triphosphate hydrolase protein [Xylaria acuta]|nr:P-loop containing nucleoside triphosphate hydrolase protein [Xylaria acuta]